MKIFNLFSLFLLIVSSCSFSQKVENVDAKKFKELCDSGKGIILDVRTSGEYAKGHISNSTAISISDRAFESKINFIQKDKPIYVYCLSGARSASAAKILLNNGFKEVYNLQPGILSWQREGYKLEASNDALASSAPGLTSDEFNKILKANKLVLCDFNAVWCAPCKKMLPIVDKVEKDYKSKINVQKIDIESSSELAKSYSVYSVPYFLIFKDGKKVWEKSGITTYEELAGIIKKYQ
ncbi:MAG: hypothetical protein A2033_07050 [Bacteroidetes bacterium GWA2_31_9]|nr:MAG: hypothetical protein A2033_07050 [Bacteroidetes bacterium GWA2_31_9]